MCLHLAQLDGETVDVVLNLLLALLGLGVLVSQRDAANQRMVAGGGVFERQVIGQVAVSASATNLAKPRPMTCGMPTESVRLLRKSLETTIICVKFLNSPRSASALYPRPLGLAQFLDRMPALGAVCDTPARVAVNTTC